MWKLVPIVLLVVATLTGPIAAQTSRPADDRSAQPADDPPSLLAGPRVTPDHDEPDGPRDRRPTTVGSRQWYRLVQGLDLSPDQRREIVATWREHERAMKSFRTTHGPRIETLIRLAREARADGGVMPAEDRRELRRLQSLRPDGETYQLRIWHRLDEAQQQRLRRELTAARREIDRRRAAEREKKEDGVAPPASGLDEAADRRLRFLRSRQMKDSRQR